MIEEITESIAILDQVTIVISAISMIFSFAVWLKTAQAKNL